MRMNVAQEADIVVSATSRLVNLFSSTGFKVHYGTQEGAEYTNKLGWGKLQYTGKT